MRNFILFYPGNPPITHSEVKQKILNWPAGHCRGVARCTVGHGGWATMQCTTEFTASIFAATTKDERKTKCSGKKEAMGNELLGNAFFRD
ncbi:TPA: hypothetical protein HA361_00955 [Candidatus Woesearchaeota archaeon]|nr:hypothetical protein [Candidatus Woesearchaeota archaeon]HII68698.1 hypothetical protein [Candidatus Woesearchaeota archaeon]